MITEILKKNVITPINNGVKDQRFIRVSGTPGD